MSFSLLTACGSNYQRNFDCASGKGLGCKSVSEVNSSVSSGKIVKDKDLRVWVAPNYDIGELEGHYQYLSKIELSK